MNNLTAATNSPSSQVRRRCVDWEAVERDYRLGIHTLRELGDKHGVNHATVKRRADREGWTKDLTGAVRQATRAALVEATVQQALQRECNRAHQATAVAVLAAAEIGKQVILDHRKDARRARGVVVGLLAELDDTRFTAGGKYARLAEVLAEAGMDPQQARSAVERALALPGRIKMAKDLADSLRVLQTVERTAFGLDDAPPTGRYEDLLAAALGDDPEQAASAPEGKPPEPGSAGKP